MAGLRRSLANARAPSLRSAAGAGLAEPSVAPGSLAGAVKAPRNFPRGADATVAAARWPPPGGRRPVAAARWLKGGYSAFAVDAMKSSCSCLSLTPVGASVSRSVPFCVFG